MRSRKALAEKEYEMFRVTQDRAFESDFERDSDARCFRRQSGEAKAQRRAERGKRMSLPLFA